MPIDYKKYPPNWKSEIVPAIRERSGDKCEFCGLSNKQMVWTVPFRIKNNKGRCVQRKIWFSDHGDALREAESPYLITKVRVVLTTAHLDHDEENHDVSLERLAHLCQLCHLRLDAKEKFLRANKKWRDKSQ